MKLNVADAATKLLAEIRANRGFNGVRWTVLDHQGLWHEQYAIFLMDFETYVDADNDYILFNYDQFRDDLSDYVSKKFPGCKVNHNWRTQEWEILGPDYENWYEKHKDELEDFYEKNWEKRNGVEPLVYTP